MNGNSELDPTNERSLRIIPASAITPRPVHWLLHHLIPQAAVTLLAGREGLGKSTMWAMWAADVTHGRMVGDMYGKPADVLVVANEDSREHTLTPRLIAAGADLDRVHFVDATTLMGSTSVVLPLDTARLAEAIRETSAALVVVDPLVSVLDGKLDSHNDHKIRQALDPLNRLAATTGVSILGLVHLNKGTGTDVLDRILGSRAFTAAARAVLAMTLDPEDESGRQLLVGQAKSNLGPRTLEALVVVMESATIATDEGPANVGRAVIVDRREIDLAAAMRPAGEDDLDDMSDIGRWLLDFLHSNGGESSHSDVMAAGKRAGFSKDQVKRAGTRYKVVTRRTKETPSRTTWHSPQSVQSEQCAQSAETHDTAALTESVQSVQATVGSTLTALSARTALTADLAGRN